MMPAYVELTHALRETVKRSARQDNFLWVVVRRKGMGACGLWITSLLSTGPTGQAGDLWTTSLLPTDPQPYRNCDK